MTPDTASTTEPRTTTFRSKEPVSTLYKCSVHGVWLTMRTVSTVVGVYRFWQCPVSMTVRNQPHGHGGRCQTCKPCKHGERIGKRP